eukprot:1158071-Pelagomonas_calceolata.AAC.7
MTKLGPSGASVVPDHRGSHQGSTQSPAPWRAFILPKHNAQHPPTCCIVSGNIGNILLLPCTTDAGYKGQLAPALSPPSLPCRLACCSSWLISCPPCWHDPDLASLRSGMVALGGRGGILSDGCGETEGGRLRSSTSVMLRWLPVRPTAPACMIMFFPSWEHCGDVCAQPSSHAF